MKKTVTPTLDNIDGMIEAARQAVNDGSVTVQNRNKETVSLPYRFLTASGGCTVKKSETNTKEEKEIFNAWFRIAGIVKDAGEKGKTKGSLSSVKATGNIKRGLGGVTCRTSGVSIGKAGRLTTAGQKIIALKDGQSAVARLAKLERIKKELEAEKNAVASDEAALAKAA